MMSYRSITAATPIRTLPSSMRFSMRTTFPNARTKTSEPWVISAGSVRVISSSEPGNAPSGNVSRLAFLRVRNAFGRHSNNHWQRQVVASCNTSFRHYPHPPGSPVAETLFRTPFLYSPACHNTALFVRTRLNHFICVTIPESLLLRYGKIGPVPTGLTVPRP